MHRGDAITLVLLFNVLQIQMGVWMLALLQDQLKEQRINLRTAIRLVTNQLNSILYVTVKRVR